MRPHAGKLRDHLAERKVRVRATSTCLYFLKSLVGRRLVLLVRDVLGGRADDHRAIDCWRDENALAHLRRALEHRRRERAVLVAVEHQVLPASRRDGVFRWNHEIAYLVGVDARAVHDSPGNKLAPVSARNPVGERRVRHVVARRRDAGDVHHLRVEEELGAVRRGVLGVAKGQLVGAADAARRRPERGGRLGRDVRLAAAQLVLRDYLRRDAVLLAARLEFRQRRLVFRAECEDERAVAPERNFQFAADVLEHAVAEDVELRLVRPRLRVKSRVDDGAVRLGRALGDVAPRLEDGDIQVPARQFPRRRAAYHARANHDDIGFHHFNPSPALYSSSCFLAQFVVTV